MTYEELLNLKLLLDYPESLDNYLELRTAFVNGISFARKYNETSSDCPVREWHDLREDPTDLPDPYKVCLIKFSDGSGGVSSMILKTKKVMTTEEIEDEETHEITTLEVESTITYKVWVTTYRDDIVAWSYYGIKYNNGSYV